MGRTTAEMIYLTIQEMASFTEFSLKMETAVNTDFDQPVYVITDKDNNLIYAYGVKWKWYWCSRSYQNKTYDEMRYLLDNGKFGESLMTYENLIHELQAKPYNVSPPSRSGGESELDRK